jgi:hypothetical protein
MIVTEGIFPLMERNEPLDNSRIESLKKKINDEDYLFEAVQRIAQVLSNEITGISKGKISERKRG